MISLPTTPKRPLDFPGMEYWPLADSDIAILKGLFHASDSQYLELAFPPLDRSNAPRAAASKVLLVDDCPLLQLHVCTMLAQWGILPELAHDGVEAVLLAREQDFDLILMGSGVPVMDGLAATMQIRKGERLRKAFRRVPVVALGASSLALDEALWRRSGIDAVLGAPIDALAIAQCLEHWCPVRILDMTH